MVDLDLVRINSGAHGPLSGGEAGMLYDVVGRMVFGGGWRGSVESGGGSGFADGLAFAC